MKKTIAAVLAVLMALSLLAACSSDYSAPASAPGDATNNMAFGVLNDDMYYEYMDMEDIDADYFYGETGATLLTMSDGVPLAEPQPVQTGGGLVEKIIYTVYAEIESINFDETIAMVDELLEINGAFIESSSFRGRNHAQEYLRYQPHRTARFTLRVPRERLSAMTDSLSTLGNVVSVERDSQNITSQFFDTESRLTALRTQEASLIEMLSKAETVADMILINEQLSEVRYGIESLTSTLRNWQTQVDYSTLTLHIQEVEIYTETEIITRTYWQQIGDGLLSSTRGVGQFFSGLFKWLIIYLPVIVTFAVIAAVVLVFAKTRVKTTLKKKENPVKEEDAE